MRRCVPALALAGLIAGCASSGPTLRHALDRPSAPSVELTDVPFFPQEQYQCGPAALATALSYSGLAVTPDALAPRVYLPGREGSLQVEMLAAGRRYDRIPYRIRPAFPALLSELNANRPVVVFQNLGLESVPVWHFAVVIGYSETDDTMLLRSGREKRQAMSASRFLRTWEAGGRWALVVLRPGELPTADDADGYLRAVAAAEAVRGPAGLAQAYRAAMQRWPDNAVARFGFANALQASGEVGAAVEQYRALVAQYPGDIAALNNLADALNVEGCRAEALMIIDRALSAGPEAQPLRDVLEQTRREILSLAAAGGSEPQACRQ